jgi:hypothetical protein
MEVEGFVKFNDADQGDGQPVLRTDNKIVFELRQVEE